jgi:hypothetical protein
MRINWGAVGVAGVVYWLFQAGWFTIFQVPWENGLRMSPEEIATYKAHPNFIPYVIALICNLVLAFIIARVLALGGVWTLVRGFRIGLLVGIAIALAMLTEMHFEDRLHTFIAVSAGAPLAGCIVMGLILGAWKPKLESTLTDADTRAGGI